jgi:hypothetical protein
MPFSLTRMVALDGAKYYAKPEVKSKVKLSHQGCVGMPVVMPGWTAWNIMAICGGFSTNPSICDFR